MRMDEVLWIKLQNPFHPFSSVHNRADTSLCGLPTLANLIHSLDYRTANGK